MLAPSSHASCPRTRLRSGPSPHPSTRSRRSPARAVCPSSSSSRAARSTRRSFSWGPEPTDDAHSRYVAATPRAPLPALSAADSSRSRARSSSIPSAAATRCRRAEAASRDCAAARCSSRRRMGARSAYSAVRYSGWAKPAGVLASPGHHVTKPVPSNASSASAGWSTGAIRPATGNGTASPTTDSAAAISRASGGSSASRARIVDASDRGTGSSPPGAASCAKESSASKVRAYNARPPPVHRGRPAVQVRAR